MSRFHISLLSLLPLIASSSLKADAGHYGIYGMDYPTASPWNGCIHAMFFFDINMYTECFGYGEAFGCTVSDTIHNVMDHGGNAVNICSLQQTRWKTIYNEEGQSTWAATDTNEEDLGDSGNGGGIALFVDYDPTECAFVYWYDITFDNAGPYHEGCQQWGFCCEGCLY